MIRVLVVEDSPTVSLLLKSILDSDPEIKVIETAKNGEEGLRKTLLYKPDLVTMDIHMPGIDGFEATRRIMSEAPRPIIIVTASFDPQEVKLSFQALEAGALAVIEKPVGPGSPRFQENVKELIKMVKLLAEVKVVHRRSDSRPIRRPLLVVDAANQIEVIGMGASTGGPAALATILGGLPEHFPVPILIVQHIAAGFDAGLAEWLAASSRQHVALAQDGQLLLPGQVLIAPQGYHLGISSSKRVILDAGSEPIGAFRPSATYLFKSMARVFGPRAIGVILTGMGSDGTPGLSAFHTAGGYIIAQDEASSVVYGMPGAAAAAGIVDQILPLNRIANALSALLQMENKT
ncbi:MAG: chemotaxis-specific protein-glutamate methyltransferase CheB [Chloroflexi bacterium]|nr:chemotaxis-specific protein-glutamate methyltransferase CheB [Chloroflexota bacterium]